MASTNRTFLSDKLNRIYFELQSRAAECAELGHPAVQKRLLEISSEIGDLANVINAAKGRRYPKEQSE